MWRAHMLTTIIGSCLTGHITGAIPVPMMEVVTKVDGKASKVPNPAYDDRYATD
jgi:hypothetical protein